MWVVVPVVGVVVLLLLLWSSATAVEWWWCVSGRGEVASVDALWCAVVGGVCIVECGVVVMHMGWSVDAETGGGVLAVDIWVGVSFGSGGGVCGGCILNGVVGVVVGGCGGVLVVFGHHTQLFSTFPAQLVLTIFPA